MTTRLTFALSAVLALWACGGTTTIDGSGGAGGGGTTSSSGTGGTGNNGSGGNGGSNGTGGAGGSVLCNPSSVICDAIPPACVPGEVASVQNGCWGPCVPILDCATEPNCDMCSSGFCAEYVAFVVEYRCVQPTLMCSSLGCGCVAPYFCVGAYNACSEMPTQGVVSCGCPAC